MEPTTRAYTVRLAGEKGTDWQRQLWLTHSTANHAVRVWGEWLLTLRGGLPASLVDDPELLPVTDKDIAAAVAAAKKADPGAELDDSVLRNQLELARRDRFRVVLTISWLSVEAGQPGEIPDNLIVSRGSDSVQGHGVGSPGAVHGVAGRAGGVARTALRLSSSARITAISAHWLMMIS